MSPAAVAAVPEAPLAPPFDGLAHAAAAAGSASHPAATNTGRALRAATLPALALPPITAFLPPIEDVGIDSMSSFMTRTGLPSWEELGLPPISELMKPVGGPEGAQLPSPAEIYAQASAVADQVIVNQLPKALLPTYKLAKALGLVRLPGADKNGAVNVTAIPLPKIPKGLPTLASLLAALRVPGMNATATVLRQASRLDSTALAAQWDKPIALPPLALPDNLPSFQQVLQTAKLAQTLMSAASAAGAAPAAGVGSRPAAPVPLPSFADVMAVVNQIGKTVKLPTVVPVASSG